MLQRRPVLFLTDRAPAADPSRALWPELVRALERRGISATISLPGAWRDHPELLSRMPSLPGLRFRREQPWNPLRRILRRGSGEVAHAGMLHPDSDLAVIWQAGPFDGHRIAEVCLDRGVPYLLVCGTPWEVDWPPDSRRELLLRVFGGALHTVFVSEYTRERTCTLLATDLPRCSVLPAWHAAPVDPPEPWPASTGEWHLAHVGPALPVESGIDLLFDVLGSDRWKSRPMRCTLYCWGPMNEWISQTIAASTSERIRLVPGIPDPKDVWPAVHGALYPCRRGSLVPEMLDAMGFARVPITVAAGEISEVVHDGRNGFVSPAANRVCLSETIERAWECRGDGDRLGLAAAATVRRMVPALQVASGLADLILDCLTATGSSLR